MIDLPPPYGLTLTDAAHHFGLQADHEAELFDDTCTSQMTICGTRISVHETSLQPAGATASTHHIEVTVPPHAASLLFTGSASAAENFAVWAVSDFIAAELRPDPRNVPLRLPLHDPGTLALVGQLAVAADDEPAWTGGRWWCFIDDGQRLTRTAGDLHTALHEAVLGIDAFFGRRRLGRHHGLLHAAYHHAIATVSYNTSRAALDRQLATTPPGSVRAVRTARQITGWKPVHVTAALRRHYNLARPLIDTFQDQDRLAATFNPVLGEAEE